VSKTAGEEPDPLRRDDILVEEGDGGVAPAWGKGSKGGRKGGRKGGHNECLENK